MRGRMRRRMIVLSLVLLAAAGAAPSVKAQSCQRGDFEAVVDQASATLRELAQKNTPLFQAKLRGLKGKRAWSHEQFLKDGAGFVRDDRITELDEKSEALLARINQGGDGGGGGTSPDCRLLDDLRGSMRALVETQLAKWAYMFAKIDAELAK